MVGEDELLAENEVPSKELVWNSGPRLLNRGLGSSSLMTLLDCSGCSCGIKAHRMTT